MRCLPSDLVAERGRTIHDPGRARRVRCGRAPDRRGGRLRRPRRGGRRTGRPGGADRARHRGGHVRCDPGEGRPGRPAGGVRPQRHGRVAVVERLLRRLRDRVHPRSRRDGRSAAAHRPDPADRRRRRRRLGTRLDHPAGRRGVHGLRADAARAGRRPGPGGRAAAVDRRRAGVRPRPARRERPFPGCLAGLRRADGVGRRAVPDRRAGPVRRRRAAARAGARRVRGRPVRGVDRPGRPAAHRGPHGPRPHPRRPGRRPARPRRLVLAPALPRRRRERRAPAPVVGRRRRSGVLRGNRPARHDAEGRRRRRRDRRRAAGPARRARRLGAVPAAAQARQLGGGLRVLGPGEPGGRRPVRRGDRGQPARRERRAQGDRRQRERLPRRRRPARARARRHRPRPAAAPRGAGGPRDPAGGGPRTPRAGGLPDRGTRRARRLVAGPPASSATRSSTGPSPCGATSTPPTATPIPRRRPLRTASSSAADVGR